jgi:outer membrane protein
MRKLALIISLLLFTQIHAQLKIGYVDSDTILKQMPDAVDAQKRLDALIAEWKEELLKMENELKTKKGEFEEKKLIMSESKRVESTKELTTLEAEISNYRTQKFGVNGELFKSQEEVMKPVQNRIFNVIKEVAEEEDLDFVFDRSGDILFLYAKEEYDITNTVLEKLK